MDVGKGAVRIQRQAAELGIDHNAVGQRIIFRVGCVDTIIERAAFIDDEVIIQSHRRIIDRGDRNGHGCDVGIVFPIVHFEGKAVGGRFRSVMDVGEGPIRVQGQGSVNDIPNQDKVQGIVFGIGPKHLVIECAAFGDDEVIIERNRRIIDSGHRNGYRRDVGIVFPIVHFEGKAVGGGFRSVMDVGESSIRVQGQGSVNNIIDQDEGQCIVFGIGPKHLVIERSAFGNGEVVIKRNRRIIDRGNGDGDRGGVGINGAIIHLEGEAVTEVFRTVMNIRVCPIRVEDKVVSIQRTVDQDVFEGIPIRIRAGRCTVFGTAFRNGKAVIISNRRIIERGHRDGDGGGVGIQGAIVHFEGEAVRGGFRSVMDVSEGPIRVQSQGAIRNIINQNKGQGVVFSIGPKHLVIERFAFGDGEIVIERNRRIIDRGNVDGNRGFPRIEESIISFKGEGGLSRF